MNIKANIFERKKKKLLGDDDIRKMILNLQFYIDKSLDLHLVYDTKKEEFLFYHSNKFTPKNKNEKLVYTLKNGAKMNMDYSALYDYVISMLDKDKFEIKGYMMNEIDMNDEDFEVFFNDLQLSKKETENEWLPYGLIINLSIKNKFFNEFIEKMKLIEYIVENYSKSYFKKMEKYIKKLKYEDIL